MHLTFYVFFQCERYFVFTSKHHDGFVNWDTNYANNWNSVALGPHRDIVGNMMIGYNSLCPGVMGGVRGTYV